MIWKSLVRPCKISVSTTPVNARGSLSEIIRRNSAPARVGEELKKSIQTELSTRIKRDFSSTPSGHLSRYHCRNNGAALFGFQTERGVRALCQRSGASSSGASVCALGASGYRRCRHWCGSCGNDTPKPRDYVYCGCASCQSKSPERSPRALDTTLKARMLSRLRSSALRLRFRLRCGAVPARARLLRTRP